MLTGMIFGYIVASLIRSAYLMETFTWKLSAAQDNGCRVLWEMGFNASLSSIPINNFDADKDGSMNDPDGSDNLLALCTNFFGCKSEYECKKLCGYVG